MIQFAGEKRPGGGMGLLSSSVLLLELGLILERHNSCSDSDVY